MADEVQVAGPLSTDNELSSSVGDSNPEDAHAPIATQASNQVEEHGVEALNVGLSTASPSSSTQSQSTTLLVEIQQTLEGLRRDFESRLQYDAGKQRQLDTLHEELETYRRGFHFQVLRPVITDLIALYSDMDKVAARLDGHEGQAEAAQEIALFRDQVEEILRRNGVDRYTSQTDEFDAKRQRAISTVATTDQASDKRVATRLRPGFEYEGKIVVQPEQVQTYRYVAPVDTDE